MLSPFKRKKNLQVGGGGFFYSCVKCCLSFHLPFFMYKHLCNSIPSPREEGVPDQSRRIGQHPNTFFLFPLVKEEYVLSTNMTTVCEGDRMTSGKRETNVRTGIILNMLRAHTIFSYTIVSLDKQSVSLCLYQWCINGVSMVIGDMKSCHMHTSCQSFPLLHSLSLRALADRDMIGILLFCY